VETGQDSYNLSESKTVSTVLAVLTLKELIRYKIIYIKLKTGQDRRHRRQRPSNLSATSDLPVLGLSWMS
jgi:hypothetical protein